MDKQRSGEEKPHEGVLVAPPVMMIGRVTTTYPLGVETQSIGSSDTQGIVGANVSLEILPAPGCTAAELLSAAAASEPDPGYSVIADQWWSSGGGRPSSEAESPADEV